MSDRDEHGKFIKGNGSGQRFEPGNQAALKHGGGRAVHALSSGASLVGVARELELEVHAEIESDGLVPVMRREAERYLAVARLFYGLLMGADDIADVDRFTRRYGWLASKAWKMLCDLRKMEADDSSGVLDAANLASRDGDNGQS